MSHYSGSHDRKWGCLFHSWLFSLLWTVVLPIPESPLTTPFFLWPRKKKESDFLSYAWNLKKKKFKVVYTSNSWYMIYVLLAFLIVPPFCWRQLRPTSQPRFRFRLARWPHLINILKNGSCQSVELFASRELIYSSASLSSSLALRLLLLLHIHQKRESDLFSFSRKESEACEVGAKGKPKGRKSKEGRYLRCYFAVYVRGQRNLERLPALFLLNDINKGTCFLS